MKKRFIILSIVIVSLSFFFGYHFGMGNQSFKYGKTGLPKNCRALIAENLKGFQLGGYTAEDALDSINRNCGPNGLIWNER
ncbi:MAG TPA: hypothetical protein PKH98_00695 [Candidatus Omnitrophota bacterium]|nr:hypothetical protein [Candidatus Omnitrophota bacterium]